VRWPDASALEQRSGNGSTRAPGGRVSQIASWVLLALVATATLHLLTLLATGDFSVRYVWQHSASYEGVLRRMSALLAGQEGSFLVWALLASAVAAWTAGRWRRSTPEEWADVRAVHLIASAVALALAAITVASAPFQSFIEAFPSLDVARPIEGRGLNPVLANPWMAPHTLLTLASYALIGLVAAIAFVHLLRSAQGRSIAPWWRRHGLRIGRWAWLLLSAALLTGVMWAYEEMTFGWFWSWDPVEATTLAVWLLLTAGLHASAGTGGGRREHVYAPLLMTGSFVGVVFASFVTRSGLHPSVHAFASGPAGRWLGGLLLVLVAGVAIVAVAAARKILPTPARQPWLFWAAWLLLVGAALIVWGLAYPMVAGGLLNRTVELDTGFFTLWGYVLAVGLLLLMGFGMQAAHGRRRDAAATLLFFLAFTVLAAVVKPAAGLELMSAAQRDVVNAAEAFLGGASVLSLLPPAVYALLAVAERWWSTSRGAPGRIRVLNSASAAIHVGVVAAVVGATFATVLSSTVTVGVSPATSIGAGDGVTVRVTDVQRSEHFDGAGTLVEEREVAAIEVRSQRRFLAAGTAVVSTYPERDMGRHARVLISRGLVSDTQVIYHGIAELRPDGVPVTVRRIPAVNLLWGGLLLFVVGMAVMTVACDRERRSIPVPRQAEARR
jgi:cytochrome c-type biogenesis protein CcmF